ncbi:MAG TPA: MoaD/ThiS family protein [Streptosporangiaceae bacterium]|jgi:molybdopterin converting factor small subunit|nr:MoaD/ThiS family protein [Streptosporangiaceae bacterium]
MATVTIQYWAAAREAAGVELESVEASTLEEALDAIVARRGDGSRLQAVLAASSFLVDGAAASRGAAPGVILPDAAVIEVLPQFAGGLAALEWPAAARGPRARGWGNRPYCGRLESNALQCPYQHVPKSHSGAP